MHVHRSPASCHLHPFPTRRSSDLSCAPPSSSTRANCTRIPTGCAASPSTYVANSIFSSTSETRSRAPILCPVVLRSEEHTSEVQSRGHLVCRLLLATEEQTDAPAG